MIQNLGNLAGVHQSERTAGYREVLRIDADRPAPDGSRSRNHSVGCQFLSAHAEILAGMLNEQIVLVEGAFIEQRGDPLARRHFAGCFLLADGFVATALGYG